MTYAALHVRLWWQFVLTDAMLLAEYRANAAFAVARQVTSLALTLFGFHVLYQFTDSVAGWSQAAILMLVGVFWVFTALWDMLLDGLSSVTTDVRGGTMDFVLLRPVSAQFLLSLRRVWLLDGLNVLLGLALVVYAGKLAGVDWTLGRTALAALLCLCGFVAIYALRFMLVTCAFWLVNVTTLHQLLHPVFDVGQYPVGFFKGWVRVILTFVVPVAFATTFPAQALLGTFDVRFAPLGPILALVALYAAHRFWQYAVRYYSSASS